MATYFQYRYDKRLLLIFYTQNIIIGSIKKTKKLPTGLF